MRTGNRQSKITRYGIGEEMLRLQGEGLTSKDIFNWVMSSERLPEGEKISYTSILKWLNRRKKWKAEEYQKSAEGRLDRMIALLEERLVFEGAEKGTTLDSQIKGALAIGKLMELKLKLRSSGEKSEKMGETPSLGDLLSEMEE